MNNFDDIKPLAMTVQPSSFYVGKALCTVSDTQIINDVLRLLDEEDDVSD